MNKVIFRYKHFEVRVREVTILLIVLILLFFGFKSCQSGDSIKKSDKINRICEFTNDNINDFHRLMSRADLCSEGWFKDLDAYIERLEDQNKYLKKKDKKEYKKVLKYQKEFLKDLKVLQKSQNNKNIKELEKSFKKYKKYYEEICGKGNKGRK